MNSWLAATPHARVTHGARARGQPRGATGAHQQWRSKTTQGDAACPGWSLTVRPQPHPRLMRADAPSPSCEFRVYLRICTISQSPEYFPDQKDVSLCISLRGHVARIAGRCPQTASSPRLIIGSSRCHTHLHVRCVVWRPRPGTPRHLEVRHAPSSRRHRPTAGLRQAC